MRAEERVPDLRVEAPLSEPLVLLVPEAGRFVRVEASREGQLGADQVGRLLLLLAVLGADYGIDRHRGERAGRSADCGSLYCCPGADDLVATLAGALSAERLQGVLLNHVAQHHGQLGLVLDMRQHAGRQVDPAVRQRGGVRVDVLHDPEREGGRCRGVRRDEALAERTDIALDQGIGVFARYHCLGIAVRQGLELFQQFLAFFRLFRSLLLGLQLPLDLLLLLS